MCRWIPLFCLLAVIGPLLVSVVARTLGWALLFGGNSGLVNRLLMHAGLTSSPIEFMFTETGVIVALSHVLMPYMVLSVWTALQRIDPQTERAAASLGASAPRIVSIATREARSMPGVLGIFTGEDWAKEGFGRSQYSIRDGWRSSSSNAYLKPVRRRRNLRL